MADGFKQIIGGLLVTVLGFYGVLHAEWIDVTNPNNPCGHNITQATYYQIIDDYCYAVFESSTTWTPPVETIEYALIGGGGGSKGGWEACPMEGTSQLIDGATLCTREITDTTQPTTFTPYNYGITTFNYLLIGGGGGTGGGTGSNEYPNPRNAYNGGSVLANESVPNSLQYTVTVGGGGRPEPIRGRCQKILPMQPQGKEALTAVRMV